MGNVNISEVVREALWLLENEEREAKFRDLRAAVQEGIDSGEPEPWDFEDTKRRAREEWETKRRLEMQS